jgi:hypothetical protein
MLSRPILQAPSATNTPGEKDPLKSKTHLPEQIFVFSLPKEFIETVFDKLVNF